MREYNLFVIKKEYYEYYKNNQDILYEILLKLSNIHFNINYGVSLYKQICELVDIDLLKNYINNKYNLNNERIFYINNTFVELKRSKVIIKSKYNYPKILKAFNCYNRCIFVIDFKNNDYFFLSDYIRNNALQHI